MPSHRRAKTFRLGDGELLWSRFTVEACMRVSIAVGILVMSVGCATSRQPEGDWRRADGSPADLEQLKADRVKCLNRAGGASPGSRLPMQATRNDMIDCMRTKGWARR